MCSSYMNSNDCDMHKLSSYNFQISVSKQLCDKY